MGAKLEERFVPGLDQIKSAAEIAGDLEVFCESVRNAEVEIVVNGACMLLGVNPYVFLDVRGSHCGTDPHRAVAEFTATMCVFTPSYSGMDKGTVAAAVDDVAGLYMEVSRGRARAAQHTGYLRPFWRELRKVLQDRRTVGWIYDIERRDRREACLQRPRLSAPRLA
jgi:hypothetical protein